MRGNCPPWKKVPRSPAPRVPFPRSRKGCAFCSLCSLRAPWPAVSAARVTFFQRRVLGKEVERLEHQPEAELIGPRLRALGPRLAASNTVSPDTRITPVSGVSSAVRQRNSVVLPLPEEPMMASDSPLFQRKADVADDLQFAKVLGKSGHFKDRHRSPLLCAEVVHFALDAPQRQRHQPVKIRKNMAVVNSGHKRPCRCSCRPRTVSRSR